MKPSWSEVAVLGLLLFFAMVMANGWPRGDWGFGWGAIGAIASITVGVLASRISITQKNWIKEKRDYDTSYLWRQTEGIALYLGMSVAHYLIETRGDEGALEKVIDNILYQHKSVKRVARDRSLHLLEMSAILQIEGIQSSLELLSVLIKDYGISDRSDKEKKAFAERQLCLIFHYCVLIFSLMGIEKNISIFYKDAKEQQNIAKSEIEKFTKSL